MMRNNKNLGRQKASTRALNSTFEKIQMKVATGHWQTPNPSRHCRPMWWANNLGWEHGAWKTKHVKVAGTTSLYSSIHVLPNGGMS